MCGSSPAVKDIMQILAWPRASSNPYTPLLYSSMGPDISIQEFSAKALRDRYQIWHIHWPEALLNIRSAPRAACKLVGLFAAIDTLRLRGAKIVWTMHNLRAHEALHPRLEELFWRHFIPRVDGAISLSQTGLAIGRDRFPRLNEIPTAIIPHGHYRDEYPRCSMDSRTALGIPRDTRVILFFGAIRAYKNVEGLVRAFREVATPEALLYIVGCPNDENLAETILKEANEDSRVRVDFRFVKREEVALLMQASDLVVLPYRTILNSGSALLALSFDKPVLVPDLGSMSDLRNDFGAEWVHTFSGNLDARTVEQALAWAATPRASACSIPDNYNWLNIRSETIQFYKQVASGK